MRRRALTLAGLLVLSGVGCGDDDGGGSGGEARPGGVFRIVSDSEVDTLDPGQSYDTYSTMLLRLTSRTLVTAPSVEGTEPTEVVPDLATTTGEITDGGTTYTFTLKQGVRYEPDTAAGRHIRAEDIRYAIERGFKDSVANPYAASYFTDLIVGDTEFAEGKTDHISGIDVTDPGKIVFHLRRPTGDFLDRLTFNATSPVPPEYATQLDAKPESTYAEQLAATGPYRLERKNGKVTGYQPGKKIVLVRNPNWDPATDDVRRAYPDRFEVTEGQSDIAAATEAVVDGEYDLSGNLTPASEVIAEIVEDEGRRDQLHLDPSSCFSYLALNVTSPPFDNVGVRRAVNLVIDKAAYRQEYQGELTGRTAGHVLIPGMPGFAEAGGDQYDPYSSVDSAGDVVAARALMLQAGHPNGLYQGPPLFMVTADDPDAVRSADIIEESLGKIGITLRRETHDSNTLYGEYQGKPAAGVALSPAGWCWDYPDGVTVMKPLFDGRLITPEDNNNFSLLHDPDLEALIDRAVAAEGAERARLWAEADRKVMDLAPVVPLSWDIRPTVTSDRVGGYVFVLGTLSAVDLSVIWLRD